MLEILRDDAEAARRAAEACVALSREHGLALYLALGALPLAWARAKLGDRDAGSAEFRQALADYASQGNKLLLPFYRGLLAEIEAERGGAEAALAGIDEALALAGETGEHWFDAGLHRIRGEILLKQNPADPAPAEAAFLAAIAVAQQQKARSFELRAALSLAKLYQSTGRPIDAHDVLGPALEGFSPTPEFPQIAEAKALFEALAADEAVKADAARRAQRLKLQTGYGQAVMWSKGYAAEETKAAFARVGELATEIGQRRGAARRLSMARWVGSLCAASSGRPGKRPRASCAKRERAVRLDGGGGRASHFRNDALLFQGDFAQARGALRTGAANLRSRARSRSQVPLRYMTLESRRPLIWLSTAWRSATSNARGELMDEASRARSKSAHAPNVAQHVLLQGDHARNPP